MGIFGNARKDKEKWSAVVMDSADKECCTEAELEAATAQFIEMHSRLLGDYMKECLVMVDKEIRKFKYEQACKEYGQLSRVRPYTDKEQRKLVDSAIDAFVKADDLYHHPDRQQSTVKSNQRKQKKEDFWSGVAQEEFFVDFMDDLFHKK